MVLAVKHSGKRGARVERRSVARFVINAPAGTAIASAAWSGGAVRSDCGYAMDVWADGAQRDWTLYDTDKCPRRGRAQSSGDRREAENDINASRVVLRVICTQADCSRRGTNYLRTSSVALRLVDTQDPTVTVTSAPPGWVKGDQTLGYNASDNAGLASIYRTGSRVPGDDFPCVLITATPCPRHAADSVPLGTDELGEGTQQVVLSARDVSGRTGASAPATVRVDRMPPGRADASVAGGEGWRPSSPFQVGWVNPPEGDRAPIVAAHYELCPVGDPKGCLVRRVTGDQVASATVDPPKPGEWTVRIWREDAAGNQSQALASDPVTLRWDPTPPEVAFEPSASDDPTRVAVRATDAVSGVAFGAIELSREGSGVWRQVPASLDKDHLTGRIDDSQLPAGRYQLRARASDHAGNEKSAAGATVQLPLRIASTMRAGRAHTKTVRRKLRRKGKRRTVRRRKTVYRTSARVRYRGSVKLGGRLTNGDGNPIDGAVAVFEKSEIAASRLVATVHTDSAGRFAYRARGTTSRTLTFAFPGSGIVLPAAREVKVVVPASMRASKRRLLNGQGLTFAGRAAFTATCERRKRWRLRVIVPREAGVRTPPAARG